MTYVPATNFFGSDSFTFKVNDGQADSNTATVSITVKETYAFSGFFSPIDNLPNVNVAKGGQAVPVKWRLTDQEGVPIANPASFKSVTSYIVSCDTLSGDPTTEVEEYTAGTSGLQYAGDGYWQFNWKTSKAYAGQCRTVVLTLADGSTHIASFKFK
jgi:hypothetical protein